DRRDRRGVVVALRLGAEVLLELVRVVERRLELLRLLAPVRRVLRAGRGARGGGRLRRRRRRGGWQLGRSRGGSGRRSGGPEQPRGAGRRPAAQRGVRGEDEREDGEAARRDAS